jgi:hypothetical protein
VLNWQCFYPEWREDIGRRVGDRTLAIAFHIRADHQSLRNIGKGLCSRSILEITVIFRERKLYITEIHVFLIAVFADLASVTALHHAPK